ncbi:MAG: PEP/pyruvate-binding domain-containing protein, partial [Blastocatellia bacterium]
MPGKYVYLFANGKADGRADMKDLLGGKGAGLAEMTNASLPVPPGFTITTEACNAYYAAGEKFPKGLWDQVLESMQQVERATGKEFGAPSNPLLVSVRSGAKFSMPGMMDTVLNLGLNDETLKGLARLTSNERFAYDAYRRFIQMFGKIVLGIDGDLFEHALDAAKRKARVKLDTDLTAGDLKRVCKDFKKLVRSHSGKPFPTDSYKQLEEAVKAVFRSWNGDRAKAYRRRERIPDDLGTAVNIQTMVFGNMGNDSGTGVAFTRNPATGEKKLFGDYLTNAQGEDVVAGIRTPKHIDELKHEMPGIYREFVQVANKLERHYRDMQDIEFTIERGKLWMLQTRNGKRTGPAAVKIAVDMVQEDLIDERAAVLRVPAGDIDQLLHKM